MINDHNTVTETSLSAGLAVDRNGTVAIAKSCVGTMEVIDDHETVTESSGSAGFAVVPKCTFAIARRDRCTLNLPARCTSNTSNCY